MAKVDIKLVKRQYPVIPSIQASPKKKIKEIMARLPFTFGVLWSVGNCIFFFFYGEWHDLPPQHMQPYDMANAGWAVTIEYHHSSSFQFLLLALLVLLAGPWSESRVFASLSRRPSQR